MGVNACQSLVCMMPGQRRPSISELAFPLGKSQHLRIRLRSAGLPTAASWGCHQGDHDKPKSIGEVRVEGIYLQCVMRAASRIERHACPGQKPHPCGS